VTDGEEGHQGAAGYTPEPIDTVGVELNGSLSHLREILAENVHDNYVLGRLAEGWSLGPRDDVRKTNPTLVPYADLSEGEKNFDRKTAEETLKAILRLGYRIEDPPEQQFLDRYAGKARKVWDESGGGVCGVRRVLRLRAEGFHWGSDPELYCELTAASLAAGDHTLVYDFANEGLRVVDEPRCKLMLVRDRALALAHEGRVEEAEEQLLGWLGRCQEGSAERREIASALGRLSKGAWYADGSAESLAQAIHWYRIGFEEGDGDVFPAVNVAALHAMGGDAEQARIWAEKVITVGDESVWGLASRSEALLILGDVEAAANCYRRYFTAQRNSPRDIAVTRMQAERLVAALGCGSGWLDDSLPLPKILVFAGVVPGGSRFPESEEARVRAEIRSELERLRPVAIYCSAAAGSDILLLEEAAALRIETQVILPAVAEEFRKFSIEPFGGRWAERFDCCIADAARVEVLGRHFPPEAEHSLMFSYGNDVLLGSAMLRAKHGGFSLSALAVWDGQPSRGQGGTGDFVARWNARAAVRERWPAAKVISPSPLAGGDVSGRGYARVLTGTGSRQELCAMLFADVKNYSSLTELMLPLFEGWYLREISKLMDASEIVPATVNTWGDAVYMVFNSVRGCGDFALAMSERLNGSDAAWRASGLPPGLAIRTAVHAGPVFRSNDPVTRSFAFTGSHVTHAARLEPVTQPGQVYATEAFAALAALGDVDSFSCNYVGQRKMAKGYGAAGVYRLMKAIKGKS
jgi:class 3 adenylate cyclase